MEKKLKNNEGYIYVYKCIVGPHNDVCKVGKTKHFGDYNDRLKQHSRTVYYGFVPYTDFLTSNPIATVFKVKNMNSVDKKLKVLLSDNQLSKIEIYNVDYDELVKIIYDYLKENDELIEFIKDGVSSYSNINELVTTKNNNLGKKSFEEIRDKLLAKYNNDLPEELLTMLRDKKEFKKYCSSHFNTRNFVDFKINNLVLDINFDRNKKEGLLNKLKEILNSTDENK